MRLELVTPVLCFTATAKRSLIMLTVSAVIGFIGIIVIMRPGSAAIQWAALAEC